MKRKWGRDRRREQGQEQWAQQKVDEEEVSRDGTGRSMKRKWGRMGGSRGKGKVNALGPTRGR